MFQWTLSSRLVEGYYRGGSADLIVTMASEESSLLSTAACCQSSRKELTMPESPGRRLPVYLLLDCSGSMSGEPIEAVRQGVEAKSTTSRATRWPSRLPTSGVSYRQHAPRKCVRLTRMSAFKEPRLDAGGATAMGDALGLLEELPR